MKPLIFFLLFLSSSFGHTTIYDMRDGTSFIKGSEGNTFHVKTSDIVTIGGSPNGSSLSVTEKVNIPTSKGTFAVDLARSVPVDVNRIGKAVRTLAVATGPLGLAITTVDAICSLTSICNQAGEWLLGSSVIEITSLTCANVGSGVVTFKSGGFYNKYKLIPKNQCSGVVPSGWGIVSSCSPSVHGCAFGDDMIKELAGSAVTQAFTPSAPTSADWDSKQSLLNDAQFTTTLLDKQHPVPVQAPSITIPLKFPIGSQTTTNKDSSGNSTGTQTTSIEAEITTPSSFENPDNSPSVIKITERTTVTNYDINNQVINSTETVSDGSEKPQQQQDEITITIDDVPDDVPLQTVEVPGTFSFSSWGSGSCPADKTWNTTMFGTHTFSYQLTCDFAETAKPIILLIAAIVSFMIVASIRTDT